MTEKDVYIIWNNDENIGVVVKTIEEVKAICDEDSEELFSPVLDTFFNCYVGTKFQVVSVKIGVDE